ncbi:MAG: class II glutamine amidotransferase [Thermofilaceae archaeon]|nr:class II glutamine amidotransferase [Thermofilaceae archaeon]MDW8004194.1 class II glutamine amidotransferase [Thermofilaceae archaeon]
MAARELYDAKEWFTALRKAAQNDPTMPKGRSEASHKDGWGTAAFTQNRLIFYKSPSCIWNDCMANVIAENLKPPMAVVAHARKASKGMPLGVGAAHPFALHLRSGEILFVAQNGGVNIEKTQELCKKKPGDNNVDSFVYSVALAEIVEEKGLKDALTELHRELENREAIRHMANTASLLVEKRESSWSFELGVVRHVLDETLLEYGELYWLRDDNLFAVASSTLARLLGDRFKMKPMERNEVIVVKAEDLSYECSPL